MHLLVMARSFILLNTAMKLSVVIVNYNVRYFLEQCLRSVDKACEQIDSEIFVVDNNSVDGSVDMVRNFFPYVRLIANKDNVGFSRANNQAIKQSTGKYILLLNPDTVVEKDTFTKCLAYMDSRADAGGLGVKMIDGQGRFLPESKRGLPTPFVAFCKISGLSRLFPRSQTFNRYHLGYLDKDQIHPVDVLSGAFMWLRRSTLEKTGLLDEDYFMYGEDIDLSYKIIQKGYKNIYFPKARIIHYKGESTKKRSVNYVFTFYNAMVIFARKHFSPNHARIFSFLINAAVWFRAGISLLSGFWKKAALPIADVALIFSGMWFLKLFWETSIKSMEGVTYPPLYMLVIVPTYIAVWVFSMYMHGGYDRPYYSRGVFKGMISGTVAILVIYALLPESLRYSRALIVMGAVWAMLTSLAIRHIIRSNRRELKHYLNPEEKRYLICGDKKESMRVARILKDASPSVGFIGFGNAGAAPSDDPHFLGSMDQLPDIVEIYKIDEVIFCSKNLTARQIMDHMWALSSDRMDYKIAPEESMYLIGSNSISTPSHLFSVDINSISRPQNRRSKRFFDLVASFSLLLLSPVLIWMVPRPGTMLINLAKVLFGQYSLVGYHPLKQSSALQLPPVKNGVLFPGDGFPDKTLDDNTLYKLNLLYGKDYKVSTDFNVLWKGLKNLGRRVTP